MHQQLSEKQLAANGERSADRAFRSAAFASQESSLRVTEWLGREKDPTNHVSDLESIS
jgi:hypothetical protein